METVTEELPYSVKFLRHLNFENFLIKKTTGNLNVVNNKCCEHSMMQKLSDSHDINIQVSVLPIVCKSQSRPANSQGSAMCLTIFRHFSQSYNREEIESH